MDIFYEFGLAGSSAVITTFFSNPLDVAKTKLQLQGELQSGSLKGPYKSVPDAMVKILKNDGFRAVQSGLLPSSIFQFIMNGTRLGLFQVFVNRKWNCKEDGTPDFGKSVFLSCFSGLISSLVSSPANMIKTQMQASTNSNLTVGLHSRKMIGFYESYKMCLKEVDIDKSKNTMDYINRWSKSMWRGCTISTFRLVVGSGAQLTSFTYFQDIYGNHIPNMKKNSWPNSIASSISSSIVTSVFMNPFDLVMTRLLNQPCDPKTLKGLYYNGIGHCFLETIKKEGVLGLYKGLTAQIYRVGVHSTIMLAMWNQMRAYLNKST